MHPLAPGAATCPRCHQAPCAEAPPHQLRPGTLLHERFLVGEALGQGGFGITYIGLDTLLDIRVAIKEYYPKDFSNRNHEVANHVTVTAGNAERLYRHGRDRFLQEARILARFSEDPGIVSVRDFFEENNTAYIVMEYLTGETLKQYIARTGPMGAGRLFSLMTPIMHSLGGIHDQGVIHRDISPDNLILMPNGSLKLLDFGAAREINTGESMSVMLKRGYAPEEQYRSKGKQGPWTDIYALCATMYYCLTGERPDEAPERVWNDSLPSPTERGADISPAQERVILRGLAVNAGDRFQSIRELQAALGDSEADKTSEETIHIAPEEMPDELTEYRPSEPEEETVSSFEKVSGGAASAVKMPDVQRPAPAAKPKAKADRAGPGPQQGRGKRLIVGAALLAVLLVAGILGWIGAHKAIGPLVGIEAGDSETLFLMADGSVWALGDQENGKLKKLNWSGIKAAAVSDDRKVGVKEDGTVVVIGKKNGDGQCDVQSWTDMADVAVGGYHTVGLKADGTVVAVGYNAYGQCDVGELTDTIAVAAGNNHTVGLKRDGTVLAAGANNAHQCDIDSWTDIVAVAATYRTTFGLRRDGTIAFTGDDAFATDGVDEFRDIAAFAASSNSCLGLDREGTVVSNTGYDDYSDWNAVRAVAVNADARFGLRADGTVVVQSSYERILRAVEALNRRLIKSDTAAQN